MARHPDAGDTGGDPDLSPRRQRFVEEYLIDLNATQAAIRAGYSPGSASQRGSILLADPVVRQAVDAAINQRSRRTGITQDQVLREYARLAFSDLRQVANWGPDGLCVLPSSKLDNDAAAALAEVYETRTAAGGTVRVKLHEKKGALDALARHLGLFDAPATGADLVIRNDIDLGGLAPRQIDNKSA
ncbi:MAG: terminase small subunit [Alphaproteobacteria bacterium]